MNFHIYHHYSRFYVEYADQKHHETKPTLSIPNDNTRYYYNEQVAVSNNVDFKRLTIQPVQLDGTYTAQEVQAMIDSSVLSLSTVERQTVADFLNGTIAAIQRGLDDSVADRTTSIIVNISPEEIISDEIQEADLNPEKIELLVGAANSKKIIDCSQGRLPIDSELADLLSKVLGASPEFWINLENNYRQKLAQN